MEDILYNESPDLFLKNILETICVEIDSEITDKNISIKEYLTEFLLKFKPKIINKTKNKEQIFLRINEEYDVLILYIMTVKKEHIYKMPKTEKGLEKIKEEIELKISKKIYKNLIVEYL